MASLLDFFAAPASGLLSGTLPQRPQRGGLLPVDSFGAPPQSSSELDRLRGWAQRELTWGAFPAPSTQMPSYSSGVPAVGDLPMPMRVAAGMTPGLGDAMDIADIVGRATGPDASLHWSDAFAALPFIPAMTAFRGKNVETRQTDLSGILSRWRARGVDGAISERNGIITVSKIVLPSEARNQGIGSDAMRELLDYADQTGQTVALTPSVDFGGNKSGLERFYRRLGFERNAGRKRDFATQEDLIRLPQRSPKG